MKFYVFAAEGKTPSERAFLEAGKALGIPTEMYFSANSADIIIYLPDENSKTREVCFSLDNDKPCLELPVFEENDVQGLVDEIIKFILQYKAKRVFTIGRGNPKNPSKDALMRLFVKTFSHPSLHVLEIPESNCNLSSRSKPVSIPPKRRARHIRRAWKPARRLSTGREQHLVKKENVQEVIKADKTPQVATQTQSSESNNKPLRRGFFGQDPRKFVNHQSCKSGAALPPPPLPPSNVKLDKKRLQPCQSSRLRRVRR